MLRSVLFLVFLAAIIAAPMVGAQAPPGGPVSQPPPGGPPPQAPNTNRSGGYNADPKLGVQDLSRGQRQPPRTLPPPITLPPELGGRVFSSAERDHPHSPSQGDTANPQGSGHRFGSPHPPMPPLPPGVTPPQPPRAADDDTPGSLRLLGIAAEPAAQTGGTYCVLGVIGGALGLPYLDSVYGEGWFGCWNSLWIYFTLQNVSIHRCWQAFGNWCLPGTDQYIAPMGSCDQRITQQVQWCGPFYGYETPGTYFIRDEGWVASPSGIAYDYIDSGLFSLP